MGTRVIVGVRTACYVNSPLRLPTRLSLRADRLAASMLIQRSKLSRSLKAWRVGRAHRQARSCLRSPYDYSSCSRLAGAAIPKKSKTARFKRTISSSVIRPTRAPIFVFGMVVILSTINRQMARRPLA